MTKNSSTFFFISLLLIFSCTDPNLIGLEVQPPSDGIKITLTNEEKKLLLTTVSEDSLRSDETTTLLLGHISDDQYFGESYAEFVTQFQLPYSNVDLGNKDSLIVDSVILSLAYSGSYGNNSALSVKVFNINQPIYKDSAYFSKKELNYDYTNLNLDDITYIYIEDSVLVRGQMKAPHMQLRLDASIGRMILDASGNGPLQDNSQFFEFFNGLYLKATNVSVSGGSIVYLDPFSSNTKLTVYYHSTNLDSLSLDFAISGDAARINLFNDKDIDRLIQLADTNSHTYVQSMAGYKTLIQLENLDSIKSAFNNKVINRVTLDFEIETIGTSNFQAHNRMYLVRIDNEGKDYFLTDYIVEGEDHFGGKLQDDKYSFNITRYFHQLLNNDNYTNKLYLLSSGGAVNSNRTILPKNKVGFNIIYTDL